MKCIDLPFHDAYSSFNELTPTNLMIVYQLCNPLKEKCKSEDVIKSKLGQSYLVVLENEIHYRYENHRSGEEHFEKTSKVNSYEIKNLVTSITK